MRPYKGISAPERRAERRSALIDAAIEVYGSLGYANATVRQVVQTAKLTERYFYESFQNSEDLLTAAFEHVRTDLYVTVENAPITAGTRGPAVVEQKLRVFYEALRAHPAAARLFLVEMPGKGLVIDRMLSDAMNRFADLLRFYLPAEEMTVEDALLLRGIMGGTMELARCWIAEGYASPIEAVTAAALRLCTTLSSSNPAAT